MDQVPRLSITVDPSQPPANPEALCFETGATPQQTRDPSLTCYEHHGVDFDPFQRGALPLLFEDLLRGRPLPPTFVTHRIEDIDTVLAITLYLNRDLVTHPSAPGLVMAVDMVHRLGHPALSHIDPDLGRFLLGVRSHLSTPGLSQEAQGHRLTKTLQWMQECIKGETPAIGPLWPDVRVFDTGTDGFVLGETVGDLTLAWVTLYRQGFLRGVLFSPLLAEGRRRVLAARKSPHVLLNLVKACEVLNRMEVAMGEEPGWYVDNLYLKGPQDGTLLLISHIVEVFLRL